MGIASNCLQRSCYDEGKRVAETLAFDYLRMQNVDIRVARIFNTYGPGSFGRGKSRTTAVVFIEFLPCPRAVVFVFKDPSLHLPLHERMA